MLRRNLALAVCLVGVGSPSLGCSTRTVSRTVPSTASTPSAAAPTAVVKVDKREELFGILFRLAGAEEYQTADATRYTRAVDAYFGKFKNHPAIRATETLHDSNGISFDAPQKLLIYLDDRFMPRRKLVPRPPEMDERWASVDIDGYLAKVRDFVRVSAAEDFFAAHAPYYRAVEERFRSTIARANVVGWFDAFFGKVPNATYTIVPGLLTGENNYGAHAVLEDGHTEVYAVVYLENIDDDGLPRPDEGTTELLIHELAHSYVNPFLERHGAVLDRSLSSIFKMVEKPMLAQAYDSGRIVGNESMVRAVTALYLKETDGKQRSDAFVRDEANNGFFWVEELAGLLEDYRRSRAAYRDIEAFFPRIASFFDGVARRYEAHGLPRLLFRGPINAVLGAERAVVGPKANADTRALKEYLIKYREKISSSGQIGDAAASTWSDFRDKNVVLYGSPSFNGLVREFLGQSELQVTSDGISVGGKRYDGPSLVLIACRPNPTTAHRGVLVYTAARDADLVGVNSVYHGSTDWVVARRRPDGSFDALGTGNFDRRDVEPGGAR